MRETYSDTARRAYAVSFRLVLPLLAIAAAVEGVCIARLL